MQMVVSSDAFNKPTDANKYKMHILRIKSAFEANMHAKVDPRCTNDLISSKGEEIFYLDLQLILKVQEVAPPVNKSITLNNNDMGQGLEGVGGSVWPSSSMMYVKDVAVRVSGVCQSTASISRYKVVA